MSIAMGPSSIFFSLDIYFLYLRFAALKYSLSKLFNLSVEIALRERRFACYETGAAIHNLRLRDQSFM
jgi:hypothetical protein